MSPHDKGGVHLVNNGGARAPRDAAAGLAACTDHYERIGGNRPHMLLLFHLNTQLLAKKSIIVELIFIKVLSLRFRCRRKMTPYLK